MESNNKPRGNHNHKRRQFDHLVFGRQPVLELLLSDKQVDKVLLQTGVDGDIIAKIRKEAALKEVPIKIVPQEKLTALTGGNHQGVIAFAAEIEFQKIEHILPLIIERGETPLLLILDGITDVRNFGAIARTAYAAGVHAIIIPMNDTAPVNADAIKTSAGALQKIPVCREKNFAAMLDFLQLNGLQIIGTDGKAEKIIYQVDLTIPLAFVFGSEDEGMSFPVGKSVTQSVALPMVNSFDSYNVSVAAAMALFETMRQRI